MDLLKILTRFRSEPSPELKDYDGKSLSTFSKDDLLEVSKRINFEIQDLLVLGNINDDRENLCKLLHFALEQKDTLKTHEAVEPPKKKKKVSNVDTNGSTVKTLEEKIEELERKLEDKKNADELSELQKAKKEVKEEAAKGDKVNIDILHEKLIALEHLARKRDSDMKEKISLILNRFHVHKNNPVFAAAFVLKLVCSKEEEVVLDKEQKLMKSFGMDKQESNVYNLSTNTQVPPQLWGTPYNYPYAMPPRFPFPPRRHRPRMNNQNAMTGPLCFRCHKPGHLVRDCPLSTVGNN